MKLGLKRLKKPVNNYHDREIETLLRPLLTRLQLKHFLSCLLRGITVMLLLITVLLLYSYIRPWAAAGQACLAAGAGVTLLTILIAIYSRPGFWEAACLVDAIGLKERVTTALELSTAASTVIRGLQREDTLKHLRGFDINKHFSYTFPVREGKALGVLAVLLIVLLLFPNPQREEVARELAVRQEITRQEMQLEKVKKDIRQRNHEVPLVQREEIINNLDNLQRSLQEVQKQGEALKCLAAANDKLQAMQKTEDIVNNNEIDRLAKALKNDRMTRSLGQKISESDTVGIKNEIAKIQLELPDMPLKQRENLATSLQNASSLLVSPALKKGLSQTASSLNQDSQGVASQMAALEAMLSEMSAGAAVSADLGQAQLAVQSARMGIIAAAGGADGSSLAATGAGYGDGTHKLNGNAASSGGGSSSNTGTGQGQKAGAGSDAGPGSNNADNASGRGGALSDPAKGNTPLSMKYGEYEKIYDPERLGRAGDNSYVKGQAGKGPEQTVEIANPGVIPGSLRPYQEVLGQYSQAARESLDRTVIPPGMQDVVRDYFSSLEE